MKKSRFREEQMVTILREADRRPVPEVAKQHGVSAQTIYSWRKHFGTLEPADVKRLRQLEQENGRLKKMVADRDLEIDVLKEITRKNGRRTCAPAAGRVCAPTKETRGVWTVRSTQNMTAIDNRFPKPDAPSSATVSAAMTERLSLDRLKIARISCWVVLAVCVVSGTLFQRSYFKARDARPEAGVMAYVR